MSIAGLSTGPLKTSTDLAAVFADPAYPVFFDASGTLHRARFVEMAAAAGKAIYCEKPTAVETAEALRLAGICEKAGVKNGVVQDKLWLPGLRKMDKAMRKMEAGAKAGGIGGWFTKTSGTISALTAFASLYLIPVRKTRVPANPRLQPAF